MEELDLTTDSRVKKIENQTKEPLNRIVFTNHVLIEMLKDFQEAKPNEAIGWCSGTAKDGLGIVDKYWGCEMEYANPAGAKTRSDWLLKLVKLVRDVYPETNLFVESHSHPIGSRLSGIDKNGLLALTGWNREIYWVMVACDFRFGSYVVEDGKIKELDWEVERGWLESSQLRTEITSTTKSSSWARRLFGRLRRLL